MQTALVEYETTFTLDVEGSSDMSYYNGDPCRSPALGTVYSAHLPSSLVSPVFLSAYSPSQAMISVRHTPNEASDCWSVWDNEVNGTTPWNRATRDAWDPSQVATFAPVTYDTAVDITLSTPAAIYRPELAFERTKIVSTHQYEEPKARQAENAAISVSAPNQTFSRCVQQQLQAAASRHSPPSAHQQRPEPSFPCKVCDRRLCNRTALQRHLLVHSGAKPFSCPDCKRAFRQKGTMVRHKRTHRQTQQPSP